jgi:Putative polyhydroxyalkanoic acid system protein (PHA_gran_rgn)
VGTHKVPSLRCRGPALLFISNHVGLHRVASVEDPKMSAPLVVSIPHRLGREEATRRLKAGLTRAASSMPVLKVEEERWEDDRMIFRVRALGQAASGHLDVADDHVRLEVTLPWLLQRFAQAAQVAIRNRGNLLLTKRS